jgi:hypothetical protein
MIPGLSLDLLLAIHVVISLVAIASGLIAMMALATARWLGGMQAIFLVTTFLTSATGFLFPFGGVSPAFLFGVLSVVALAIAGFTLVQGLTGRARQIAYAAAATFALYLNMFVLVFQSFQKLPALQPLAPTQSEPPFLAAQLVLLLAALALGVLAGRRSAYGAPRAA